jgi:hypothetical protein
MQIPPSEMHELVTEFRLLRTEFAYIKEQLILRNQSEAELFDRIRAIEQSVAVLQAQKQPRVNGWTIGAVLIAAMLALITMLETFAVSAMP